MTWRALSITPTSSTAVEPSFLDLMTSYDVASTVRHSRHQPPSNPCFSSQMASYDVASTVHESRGGGGQGAAAVPHGRHGAVLRIKSKVRESRVHRAWFQCLKLQRDELISNFASNIKLRRYAAVCVHRLPTLEVARAGGGGAGGGGQGAGTGQLARSKGCTNLFEWDDSRGMLCVATKRRLLLYHHDGRDFVELKAGEGGRSELSLHRR